MSMWHQESGAKKFAQQFGPTKAKMRFVDHHLAHAISAYAYSGFEDAAVVVMDGRGAWEATTIWQAHNGRLDPVLMIPFPDSVGHFYSEFTEFLGFQSNSDDECSADGHRENRVPESLSCRRRGAEFESQWKNRGIRSCG